jgi:hypothetical protein
MRTRYPAGVVAALVFVVGGCATGEEWGTWQAHPVHFASGEHMSFSFRNTEGRTPMVARRDIAHADSEGWWGKAVTVGQEQILER